MQTENIINKSLVDDSYVINILPDEHFNDNNLNNDNSDNNSVVSDVDVDGQTIKTNTKINTLVNTHAGLPEIDFLKLQKFYANNNIVSIKNTANKQETVAKAFISIIIIIIGFPIIFCDLYYAYNDNSCVKDYPNTLNINMKTYLLVNGYYSIATIICIILWISCISFENIDKKVYLIQLPSMIEMFVILFITIWNIIGAVIFWGKLYKEEKCDKNVSTYLFISLIIKLLSNSMALNKLKK
jgi:hypothetical protein